MTSPGNAPESPGHATGSTQSHVHAHSHSHGPAAPVSKHLRKVIAAVVIPFATAVLVGLVAFWPGGTPAHERTGVGFDRQTQDGRVTKVVSVDCADVNASQVPPTGDTSTPSGREAVNEQTGQCKKATVEVTTGEDKGRTFVEVVQPDAPRQLHEGQGVVVAYAPDAPRDLQYSVTDVDRTVPMAVLAGLFALAVVVVGRLRGLMALIALAVSFAVLTLFILPRSSRGRIPWSWQ